MKLSKHVSEEGKYSLHGIMQSLKWTLFLFTSVAYLWNVNRMW